MVSLCPDRLGEEIALIGSAASGWADDLSDFELVLFANDSPDPEAVAVWAHDLGVTSTTLTEQGGDRHLIGRYQDVWVELQWRTFEETSSLIDSVLNAETTSRQALVSVQAIDSAVPLRTSGQIASWQKRLQVYPDRLAQRVVSEATEFWRAPHHIGSLWALADRAQPFSPAEWLQADIQDALRVLFAINHRWEPDWKWLQHQLASLSLCPDRLGERIDAVCSERDPHKAVAIALQVIEDILVLAEPGFAVSTQLDNIRRARNHRSAPTLRLRRLNSDTASKD